MRKILAVLSAPNTLTQFPLPELKSLLTHIQIPTHTLFSIPIHIPHHKITHKIIPTFPYIPLTIPNFHQYQSWFQYANQRSVLIKKFIFLISQAQNYEQLVKNADLKLLNQCLGVKEEKREMELKRDIGVFGCDFGSWGKSVSRDQMISKIDFVLNGLNLDGKMDIKNATKRFSLLQLHSPTQSSKPQKVFFGYVLTQPSPSTQISLSLSNRIYLGPTSTTPPIAQLMCNQAKINPYDFVYDPFMGTGSLLISSTIRGAICFGSDIDDRVLQGYGVGRINTKSTYYSQNCQNTNPKIMLNFDQYGLERPNIFRVDTTKCQLPQHVQFDAIVTDPPYGIRAMSRTMVKENSEQQKKNLKNLKANHEQKIQKTQQKSETLPSKWSKKNLQITDRETIFKGLLSLSTKHLKKSGRLVFLYPIFKQELFEIEKSLPDHKGFTLIDFSQSKMAANNSRLLITLQKK